MTRIAVPIVRVLTLPSLPVQAAGGSGVVADPPRMAAYDELTPKAR